VGLFAVGMILLAQEVVDQDKKDYQAPHVGAV